MKTAPDHLIYESAHRGNILPLTSNCNVRCLFCSHRQNPAGIEIYRIPPLSAGQVAEVLQFISPAEKIVIGESVTRITEGEPFTHPEIRKILYLIRERFPVTTIQLTTNGTLIDRETANFLAGLGRVELNLSLNSAVPGTRRNIMGDVRAEAAVEAPAKLAEAGVPFHGSIVAMPHITGWDDLGSTIHCLSITGAKTVRVFMPGFTRLAPANLRFGHRLREELACFLDQAAQEIITPVILEPPLIKDLTAVIRGVISGSPAAASGLRKDDVIRSINGKGCASRVDAFQKIKSGGKALLEIVRSGKNFSIVIEKKPGEASGLVMDYDISPGLIEDIKNVFQKNSQTVLLCSQLGAPVLRAALGLENNGIVERGAGIIPVQNTYFAGSIMAAGLLTVPDFINAVKVSGIKVNRDTTLLLPAAAFDLQGRDLTGNNYLEIEEAVGCKAEIV